MTATRPSPGPRRTINNQVQVSVAELVHSVETPPAPQAKRPWRRG
ncbi:hypothetical protein [Kitasatospora sp. NPDC004289]